MRRSLLALCLPLLLVGAAPATQPDESTPVPVLIEELGDARSVIREAATTQLIARGLAIRNDLIEASKSEDPEISLRAGAILRSFPWERPNDPPAVKQILIRYKVVLATQRAPIIQQLLKLPNDQGLDAIFRLLQEETDPRIRWTIVQSLRKSWSQDKSLDGVDTAKSLDVTANDPPILCTVAQAILPDQPQAAVALYLRAAQNADFSGNDDLGEIDFAVRNAIITCKSLKQYDQMAKFIRCRTQRTNAVRIAGVPDAVCELFALHARYGPLAGYAADCRQYSAYLLSPPILYTHAQLLLMHRHPLAASAVNRLALFSGSAQPVPHHEIGDFLQFNGWQRAAVGEFKQFLAIQSDDDSPQTKADLANAHFSLGNIYSSAEEHGLAATEIEQGLALIDQLPTAVNRMRGGRTFMGEDAKLDLKRDAIGQHFLDAVARNDPTEIAARLKELQAAKADDPEIVQEMVAQLTKAGDQNAADQLFTPIEAKLRADLAANPTSPQEMNSVAWFLARSGRKLDDALKFAEQAVAADPKNGALIDTLAEVHFQRGESKEAVALETKALAADPGRPELERQMRRFKSGKN